MLRSRKLLVALGIAFTMGVVGGLSPSLEAFSQGGCLEGYECVVDPAGDDCLPGFPWDGCEMHIETCSGC